MNIKKDDIILYASGAALIIGIIRDIPQLLKIRRTRNVESISVTAVTLGFISLLLWMYYHTQESGFYSVPMVGIIWSLMVDVCLLYYIKKYGKDKMHT
tara:strand:+ start:183 stop:476 length:294 start_codon:yes stop_codon:yes gene_type:complete